MKSIFWLVLLGLLINYGGGIWLMTENASAIEKELIKNNGAGLDRCLNGSFSSPVRVFCSCEADIEAKKLTLLEHLGISGAEERRKETRSCLNRITEVYGNKVDLSKLLSARY
jgi:hypothetical protein